MKQRKAQSRDAAKSTGSTIASAISIALPLGVSALFLWWYATIPPYSPPSLPREWSPGCPEWDVAWKSQKVESVSPVTVGCRILGVVPGTVSLLVEHAGVGTPQSSGKTELVDGASGVTMESIPQLLAWYPFSHEGGMLLSTGPPDTIIQYYPLSFDVLDSRELGLPPDVPQHASMTVSREDLWPGPDGTLFGMARLIGDNRRPTARFWFQADGTGAILQSLEFGYATKMQKPAWSPAGTYCYAEVGQVANPACIDFTTGEAIADNFLASDVDIPIADWRARSKAQLPDGWRQVHVEAWPDWGPRIEPVVAVPILIFPPRSMSLAAARRADRHWFMHVRYLLWDKLYTDEFIEKRRTTARRIVGLDLRVEDGGIAHRSLDGELLDTLAHQPLRATEHLSVQQTAGRVELRPVADDRLRVPLSVHPLDDGRMVITHFVDARPDATEDQSAMLRIGLLDQSATMVRWLGWVPLSAEQLPPSGQFEKPSFYRAGNRLLISFPGYCAYRDQGALEPTAVRPLSWAFVPLPDELADLPEGPM